MRGLSGSHHSCIASGVDRAPTRAGAAAKDPYLMSLIVGMASRRRWRTVVARPRNGGATTRLWEHAMSKAIAVFGSALFFVIAPSVLAGFVPWWVTQWEFRPAFFGVDLTRTLGGLLVIVGA